MQGPVSDHFAKVALGNSYDAQEICAQVLKNDLPVLNRMADIWHDSLEHHDYAELCTTDMAAMMDDLFEGLTVGRFVDLVAMERSRFRYVTTTLNGFEFFEDNVSQLVWRNGLLDNCLRHYGSKTQRDILQQIVAGTNTLSVLMKSWKSLARGLEMEEIEHHEWQEKILSNDADGLYGAYNDHCGRDNILDQLVTERQVGLLRLKVAYLETSIVKQDIFMALNNLRTRYSQLLLQTVLEISAKIGDKDQVFSPQP